MVSVDPFHIEYVPLERVLRLCTLLDEEEFDYFIWQQRFLKKLLKLKKKMDESKTKDSESGKKGMSFDLDSIGNFTQMLSGFTVLRLTGMVGMVGISLTEKDLLDLNRKLNKIKVPKK